MPVYEYRCQECGKVSSFLVRKPEEVEALHCRYCGKQRLMRIFSRFAYHRAEADRLAEFDTSKNYGPEFYKDNRNVGLWAKKRAQEMGVDLGPQFEEVVEKARTGKILEEYER